MNKKIVVISDVDGVLNTGQFLVSKNGKEFKVFGPHDNDGYKILKNAGFDVIFISADSRGFEITKERIVNEMNAPLYHVKEKERTSWIKSFVADNNYIGYIYIADGISDVVSLCNAFLSIVPKNGRKEAKRYANYITESNSGEGAFLDAALFIMDNLPLIYSYSQGYDISKIKIRHSMSEKDLLNEEYSKSKLYDLNLKNFLDDFVNEVYEDWAKDSPSPEKAKEYFNYIKREIDDMNNSKTYSEECESDKIKCCDNEISEYRSLKATCNADDINEFNSIKKSNETFPYHQTFVDEFDDSYLKPELNYYLVIDNIINQNFEILKSVDINDVDKFVNLILNYRNKTIIGVGAGRMGYALRGFIMRLMHLGFNASFYGDTNVPYPDDDTLVIFNSSSGETKSLVLFANIIDSLKTQTCMCTVTSNPNSSLAKKSNVVIELPKIKMPENSIIQPMKTLNEQSSMLFFDAIVMALMGKLDLKNKDLVRNHSVLE